jgi:ligand-binding sensor domain-containing protein
MKTYQMLILALFIYSCNSKIQQDTKQVPNVITAEQKLKPKIEINYSSGDVVTDGLQDRSGNLWFGTSRHGVYRYDGKSFTNFTDTDGLCNDGVFSILEDKNGLLWFGTSDGLCTYDGQNFSHIPIPNNGNEGSKTVLEILEDKEGNIWIGTWGNGAYRYDGKNFKGFLQETGRKNPDNGLYNNAIRNIIQDRAGNIWFSSLTHGGITRYDGETFINYTEQDGLCDDMVFTSFEDSKGKIWIGVIEDGDLCSYDGTSFKHYTKEDGICFNMVSCFHEDKSGKLWFGSETENGLCTFDGERFASFSVKGSDQIPSVRFILEDKKGHLWIGGRHGSLWRYDGSLLEDFTQKKNG